ncbi:MAG TPA: ABC transporter ATP-binding protein [Acidimicrobiales bacterium]|nr:ABC transporter ATP-binding protein [Acidimicrobiales bacterium]
MSSAGTATSGLDQGRPLVELRGICKSYGSLRANDDVSVDFRAGEIHVIVGENGAGKSTLMGILSGGISPDSGSIVISGEEVRLRGARDATMHGIGMVHQHFQLVAVFSVAENIALGFERRKRFGVLDIEATRADVRRVSREFGLALDPDAVVGSLPVGLQQRVEIVKILMRDPRILIFDEPTAVLTAEESDSLLAILQRLRDAGRTIVFITHKLREAIALGDRITVLRRGRVVGDVDPAEATPESLGELMVGRNVRAVEREPIDEAALAAAEVVVSVRSVSYLAPSLTGASLHDVSLEVSRGEVLGVVGVDGNGQDELTGVVTGMLRPASGSVSLAGRDMSGSEVDGFLAAGVGVIPADRQRQGLAMSMSLGRNLVLDRRDERRFQRLGGLFFDDRRIAEYAEGVIERFDVRAGGPMVPVASLSGGNQQKVVIARELERDIVLLVASQPTRGLDVGSIEYVHGRMLDAARKGCAVLLVTSELDEALALSDRIAPLYEGRIVAIEKRPFDRARIGAMMGGG